jgi:hypothetical protein
MRRGARVAYAARVTGQAGRRNGVSRGLASLVSSALFLVGAITGLTGLGAGGFGAGSGFGATGFGAAELGAAQVAAGSPTVGPSVSGVRVSSPSERRRSSAGEGRESRPSGVVSTQRYHPGAIGVDPPLAHLAATGWQAQLHAARPTRAGRVFAVVVTVPASRQSRAPPAGGQPV